MPLSNPRAPRRKRPAPRLPAHMVAPALTLLEAIPGDGNWISQSDLPGEDDRNLPVLGYMRRAGWIIRNRDGGQVRYQRTPTGKAAAASVEALR